VHALPLAKLPAATERCPSLVGSFSVTVNQKIYFAVPAVIRSSKGYSSMRNSPTLMSAAIETFFQDCVPHRTELHSPGIAGGIEQKAACLCAIIFPAIGQDTFVPIQFKSFRIGVFPATRHQ
jgi:hypothetical protein